MNNLRNSIQLIGNLGKDVEVKTLNNGKQFAKVTMATKEIYQSAAGEKVVDTQWHNLVAWGKTAENMNVFLKKGKEVCVTGKLRHRNYEDKNGIKRNVSEIHVNEFLMIN